MPTKQISAVEWLVNELKTSKHYQRVINEVNQSSTEIKDVIEQAKAMEKEQMDKVSEDWWVEGCAYMKDGKRIYESFEQYYNETYNKTI